MSRIRMPASAPGFDITDRKGFHITFENGYTVSVQFGPRSYCANESNEPYDPEARVDPCPNAEVAAWPLGGGMLPLSEDGSLLYCQTPAQVLALLNDIASRKPVQ